MNLPVIASLTEFVLEFLSLFFGFEIYFLSFVFKFRRCVVSFAEFKCAFCSSLRGNPQAKTTPKFMDCHENPSGFSRNDE